MIRILFTVLLLFVTHPVRAADIVTETPRNLTPMGSYTNLFQQKNFLSTVSGKPRSLTYFFRMPAIKNATAKMPLVLVLHGGAGWAHGGVYGAQSNLPAFIAVPVLGSGRQWAWPEGDATLHGKTGPDGLNDAIVLITQLLRDYPIDKDRLYVIGCSDGGTGVFGAARYYPDVFAAGVSISGVWNPMDAVKMTHMPFLQFYGAKDVGMAQNGDLMKIALKQAGAPVATTVYPNLGHQCDAPDFYTAKMWNWLFSQRRGTKAD